MKKQYFISDILRESELRDRDFYDTLLACERIVKDRSRTGAEISEIQKNYRIRECARMQTEREFYQ